MRTLRLFALVLLAIFASTGAARADEIFVTNIDVPPNFVSTIGAYTTSGATVNPALISGLTDALGIAVSGSNLFVANLNGNTIGEYTTSGATVNASLISGLNFPTDIVVSGPFLFVTNDVASGTVGEYTTSGATVNASLISGLNFPITIAVSGSDLFVGTLNGTIAEYTTSGALVNPALISGLNIPQGIAIVPTIAPEPSSITLLGVSLAVLGFGGWRKTRPRM